MASEDLLSRLGALAARAGPVLRKLEALNDEAGEDLCLPAGERLPDDGNAGPGWGAQAAQVLAGVDSNAGAVLVAEQGSACLQVCVLLGGLGMLVSLLAAPVSRAAPMPAAAQQERTWHLAVCANICQPASQLATLGGVCASPQALVAAGRAPELVVGLSNSTAGFLALARTMGSRCVLAGAWKPAGAHVFCLF